MLILCIVNKLDLVSLSELLFTQQMSSESTSLLIAISSVVGFFTFFTPLLIHTVTKKYVTEIIYDPIKQEYTATVLNFFLTKKKVGIGNI